MATSLPSRTASLSILLTTWLTIIMFITISQKRTARLREAMSHSRLDNLYVAEPGRAQVVWSYTSPQGHFCCQEDGFQGGGSF